MPDIGEPDAPPGIMGRRLVQQQSRQRIRLNADSVVRNRYGEEILHIHKPDLQVSSCFFWFDSVDNSIFHQRLKNHSGNFQGKTLCRKLNNIGQSVSESDFLDRQIRLNHMALRTQLHNMVKFR